MSKDTTKSDSASIAAWLRKEAVQARGLAVAAADPYGQRLSFEAADKLERAAEIVEQFAASPPDRSAVREEAYA
jgi:hypothetical protein